MLARLFALIILLPLVELALLLALGKYVGIEFTLGFVVLSGILGVAVLRFQSWQTWRSVQQSLAQGELPAESLADRLMLLLAGVLLIAPGVLTDIVGLTLLVPVCRRFYRHWLMAWFRRRVEVRFGKAGSLRDAGRPEVIDSYVVTHPSPPDDEPERLQQ